MISSHALPSAPPLCKLVQPVWRIIALLVKSKVHVSRAQFHFKIYYSEVLLHRHKGFNVALYLTVKKEKREGKKKT